MAEPVEMAFPKGAQPHPNFRPIYVMARRLDKSLQRVAILYDGMLLPPLKLPLPMGRLCPFLGGLGPPSNNVAWAEAYLHTKWHLDASMSFGHNRHGPKIGVGGMPLFGGSWVLI